jgi:hypothetical protein
MSKCREIVFKIRPDPTLEQQGATRTTLKKGALLFPFPSSHFHVWVDKSVKILCNCKEYSYPLLWIK